MKPEHFCSGNEQSGKSHPSGWCLRFNEAGAFLLRKLGRNGGCEAVNRRFNEAGAFLLRKPRWSPNEVRAWASLQ